MFIFFSLSSLVFKILIACDSIQQKCSLVPEFGNVMENKSEIQWEEPCIYICLLLAPPLEDLSPPPSLAPRGFRTHSTISFQIPVIEQASLILPYSLCS